MDQVISPAGSIKGQIEVPGDKSVSHRALILASMADGRSRIARCAPGEDVEATADALAKLGVQIDRGDEIWRVEGRGWPSILRDQELDARNSGTTMRLVCGALAGLHGKWLIRGDESLGRRPMDRVAIPLGLMGADIQLADNRFPPVVIRGTSLHGINYDLPVASAQVKAAILLAGLQAEGTTVINEALPSRDHTERMLSWLGADLIWTPGVVELYGRGEFPGFDIEIPGDFSSAAYLLVAACLIEGSEIEVARVGINPSRTGLLDVLHAMGATLSFAESSADPEPIGTVAIQFSHLEASQIGGDLIPRSIDELMLIAVAAGSASGTTVITDAEELRVKESDRIEALVEGLRAMGAVIEGTTDGMRITGPVKLRGATVDSYGDHRIALALAVAALVADGDTVIKRWEATAISYPTFLEDIDALRQ